MSDNVILNKKITAKLKQGDLHALQEIYSRHWKNIFVIAYSFLKVKEDAEDAVQDIFLQFWQKRAHLADDSDYKPYLFQIARNSLANLSRSWVKKEVYGLEHISNKTTEEAIEFNELSRFAQEAINKLPPKRKLVFDLRRNGGLSNRQIAKEMGISVTMVEKQLKLANTFIKNYLRINAGLDFHLTLLLIAIFLE